MEPKERDERPVIHKLIERIQTSFCVGRRTDRGHLAAQTELSFLAEWTRETCHRQGMLLSIVRGDVIAELEGNTVITRAAPNRRRDHPASSSRIQAEATVRNDCESH